MLVRHGQTEWSAAGRHTSHTDLDLTPQGVEQATDLRQRLVELDVINSRVFVPAVRSRRQREPYGRR